MGKRMNFVVFKEKRHIIWLRFMKTKRWRCGVLGFIKKKRRECIGLTNYVDVKFENDD